VWITIARVTRSTFGFDDCPVAHVEVWKMRIAFDHLVHDGKVKLVGVLQCLGVHRRAAGNEGSVDIGDAFERGLE
jgi:hypothetical protein